MGTLRGLDVADATLLDQLGQNSRLYQSHESIAKAGDPVNGIFVVLEGLAGEFRLLPDGRRQILSFLFPGDMLDPRHVLLPRWDHSLCAFWPTRVAMISPADVKRLGEQPAIAEAMARYSLLQHAIASEWMVNVGGRSALERVSHIFCEAYLRLQTVGLASNGKFELPLTQGDLADTLALSAVHVNRTLMELRRSTLLTFISRQVTIHDFQGLCSAAAFDGEYLRRAADVRL